MSHAGYLIMENEHFNSSDYPLIVAEWDKIQDYFNTSITTTNTDMLISFVKDHNMSIVLINRFPDWADTIRSGSVKFENTEALFSASVHQPVFRKQLEEYLTMRCSI
jgi:hypothetical protein